ncbi:MAG: hypothetical protein QM758_05330 [Armatimonas sp.]
MKHPLYPYLIGLTVAWTAAEIAYGVGHRVGQSSALYLTAADAFDGRRQGAVFLHQHLTPEQLQSLRKKFMLAERSYRMATDEALAHNMLTPLRSKDIYEGTLKPFQERHKLSDHEMVALSSTSGPEGK